MQYEDPSMDTLHRPVTMHVATDATDTPVGKRWLEPNFVKWRVVRPWFLVFLRRPIF